MARPRKGRWAKERMKTAWYDIPPTALGGQSTEDSRTLLLAGDNAQPQPTLALDWDRKQTVKIIRIILKILMVLTSTGAENYAQIVWGLRIGELDDDGSLRTAADDPSILLSSNDHRRVDWLWRDSSGAALVSSTSGTEVAVTGAGGAATLSCDFRPGRPLLQRHGLILHYRAVGVGTQTNIDAVQTASVDGRILLGRRQ